MSTPKSEQKQNEQQDIYTEIMSLSHECELKEIYVKNTSQEISKIEKELENLRLEKKWCFNKNSDRTIPTPEDQAMRICEQIVDDEDLVKEVVKALRMKKLDLQINIRQLKEICDTLKEEIR